MPALPHRSHEILKEYWIKLRGNRQFPSESDVDPDDLHEIWPSCFLISIDDVARNLGYRYSYLGNDLIEAYGDDVKNPDVALRLLSTANMSMIKRCDEVIQGKSPVIDESEFVNFKGVRIRYRACMLPLGYPDGTVSHILGCMRWKVY